MSGTTSITAAASSRKTRHVPLTIWIVPNADRKERLLYHLREAFAAEPVKLFTVITIEELPVLLQKGGNPDAQC